MHAAASNTGAVPNPQEMLLLVDNDGRAIDTRPKDDRHLSSGNLQRGFSMFLFKFQSPVHFSNARSEHHTGHLYAQLFEGIVEINATEIAEARVFDPQKPDPELRHRPECFVFWLKLVRRILRNKPLFNPLADIGTSSRRQTLEAQQTTRGI